jgi:hypothetical protein
MSLESCSSPQSKQLPDSGNRHHRLDHDSKDANTTEKNHIMPFPFYENVILVAIDLEAFWREQSRITEIGLAILDTQDIHSGWPGREPFGKNWHKLIKSRHIRPTEHLHLHNLQINGGDPDDFRFGTSEKHPSTMLTTLLSEVFSPKDERGNLRSIVLVGHDIGADIKYLEYIDFDPYCNGNVIDTIDTQRMYHSTLGGAVNSRNAGLSKVLNRMEIMGPSLHNAGNDATYTLQAMIAMALLEISRRPNPPGFIKYTDPTDCQTDRV